MPRNPYAARLVKKRKHKPGNLTDLLRMLWQALLEAEAVLQTAESSNPELKLKAVHALTQAGGAYARLLEVEELESRLVALEQAQERR